MAPAPRPARPRARRAWTAVALAVAVVAGPVVAAPAAVAAPVPDIEIAGTGATSHNYPGVDAVQTLTATRSGLLTSIAFHDASVGTQVLVRDVDPDVPGAPRGPVRGTATIDAGAVATFAEPVRWIAGDVYAVQLVGALDPNGFWRFSSGVGYGGGALYRTEASGTYDDPDGRDVHLTTYLDQDGNAAPAVTARTTTPFQRDRAGDQRVVDVTGSPAPDLTVVTGTLPAGLGLTPDGRLTGTPTQTGARTVVVEASNGIGSPARVSVQITVEGPATAPVGVSAAPGDARVTLTWSAPGDDGGRPVAGYAVEGSTDGGASWGPVGSPAVTGTSAVVSGLTNGTGYLFRVAAVTALGTGAWAPTSSTTPRTTAPAPAGLTGTRGDAQVLLSWPAPSGDGGSPVTGYAVEVSADGGGTWSPATSVPAGQRTAHLPGLTNGTAYRFRVAAVNAAGTGAWSPELALTPATAPGAPSGLTASPGDGWADLAWTAPAADGGSAVTGYSVLLAADGSSTWTSWGAPGSVAGTSTRVTGLANGTTYAFRVAAVNGTGAEGAWSDARTAAPRTTPGAPVASVVPGDGLLDVSWTPPGSTGGSTITAYAVQHSADGGDTWTEATAGQVDGTTARLTGLANGTAHLVRVAAVNAAGRGAWSVEVGGTPRTTPAAPRDLRPVAGDARVDLAWSAPSADGGAPVTGYVVEVSGDGGGTWAPVDPAAVTGATARVAGLGNGTAHRFRVAAVNAAGPGAWSAVVAATPRTAASAPVDVVASPGDAVADLAWAAPASDGGSPVTGYVVEIAVDGGAWTAVGPGAVTATTAHVTGLANGTAHAFRVAAVTEAGPGAWSGTATTTPRTAAAAPAGLAATPGDAALDVTWQAPADDGGAAVTGYVVEVSADSGATWQPVDAAAVTGTTARVSGLANGRVHGVRVAAVTAAGTGAWASTSATPFVLRPLLSGPGGTVVPGTVLRPGDRVTLALADLPAGAAVALELHSTPVTLAAGTVAADGTVTLSGALPADVPLGAHHLVVLLGGVGTAVDPVSVAVQVVAAPAAPGAPAPAPAPAAPAPAPAVVAPAAPAVVATDGAPLARTGGEVAVPAALALVLLLLGTAVVVTTRSRRLRAARPAVTHR